MTPANQQREIQVQVADELHVGHYEVQPFHHGGHSIVVFYRGRSVTDRIPPEVEERTYTDFLATKLLEGLIREADVP